MMSWWSQNLAEFLKRLWYCFNNVQCKKTHTYKERRGRQQETTSPKNSCKLYHKTQMIYPKPE